MQEVICPVCGRHNALAPGTAGACRSCGAPISAPALASPADDDSATRPSIPPIDPILTINPGISDPTVPPVAAASAAMPGADNPEETTRVAQPVSETETDAGDTIDVAEVTANYPMPPTPQRTQTVPPQAMPETESQTHPSDIVAAPPETPGAPAKPPTPSRRGQGGRVIVVLLFILLLVIIAAGILLANGKLPFFGASASPTAAPTATLAPTATPALVLTPFTDGGNVYTIGYPVTWTLSTQNDAKSQLRVVVFTDAKTHASLTTGTLAATDISAKDTVDQALAVLGQATGVANRTQPATIIVGGASWTQESGDVTLPINGQSTAMHATALAVIHGNYTVYIVMLAPVDSYPTVEPVFQQMLASFAFTS
jgi:hypothetical protein